MKPRSEATETKEHRQSEANTPAPSQPPQTPVPLFDEDQLKAFAQLRGSTEGAGGERPSLTTTGSASGTVEGARGKQPAPRPQQDSSSESSSESAPGGQGEITEARIMTALEKNAREEEEMRRNIRRDPAAYSQLPKEDDQLTLMFNICTTKNGSVYHSFPTRGYLQAVQAGPRGESRWCPLCRYVTRHGRGRPPPPWKAFGCLGWDA